MKGDERTLDTLLNFLDTLSAEERPEPYTGKYDEAYLQEKIAKATKSWEGVDVDKFMDEVRGREPVCEELEEEMDKYFETMPVLEHENIFEDTFKTIARHFYSLGQQSKSKEEPDKSLEEAAEIIAKNILGRDYLAELDEECAIDALEDAKNFVKAGAEWQKSQMLKDAVEGRVFMSFAPGHNQMIMADVDLPTNTKVHIVVLKAEEE